MRRMILCFLTILLVNVCRAHAQQSHVLTDEQLFDPNRVTDIRISLPEDDWDTIRLQTRSFVGALTMEAPVSPFTYVRGDVEIDGVRIEDVGIRKKGFLGSLNDQRPSLKIKFAEYVDQDPVRGLDRLTLNNNNQDPARLSQFLGYQFFLASGSPAPRCSLAHVTVNGNDLGVYSLVESIRKPMLERNFGDGSGALYEGTVTDFYSEFLHKIEQKNKAANVHDLQQLSDVLTSDELDLDRLASMVDLDAFIRYWAIESLLGFWDGYTNNQNNYFFYRDPSDGKFHFIPWGADALFTENMPLPPYVIRPRFVHCQSLLANRLYRIPEYAAKYHEVMHGLLAEHWDEEQLLAEIDRVEAMLSEHVLDSNTQFTSSVDTVRRFVETRRETLLDEMADGPVDLPVQPRIPPYFGEIGTLTATFDTQWFDQSPADRQGTGKVDITFNLRGEEITFRSIGGFAEFSQWPPQPAGQPRSPSLIITGTSEGDDEEYTLAVGLARDHFKPTLGEDVPVTGFLIEGRFGSRSASFLWVGGTARFDEAAMAGGEPVRGSVQIIVSEIVDARWGDDG